MRCLITYTEPLFSAHTVIFLRPIALAVQGLLGQFIDFIKERKTVALDDVAAEFGLRTQVCRALRVYGVHVGFMDLSQILGYARTHLGKYQGRARPAHPTGTLIHATNFSLRITTGHKALRAVSVSILLADSFWYIRYGYQSEGESSATAHYCI